MICVVKGNVQFDLTIPLMGEYKVVNLLFRFLHLFGLSTLQSQCYLLSLLEMIWILTDIYSVLLLRHT